MTDDAVVQDDDGHVRILRLNRPHRLNALTPSAIARLRDLLETFRDEPSARVCIITGTGDRGFCTGADLRETMPPELPFAAAFLASDRQSIEQGNYIRGLDIERLNVGKPLIAAINGHAIAGGLELALACDIRIASESATFGLPEVRIGSVPAVGGILRLMRSIPHSAAMTMILTGDSIDAGAAERLGLISAVQPPNQLMPHALQLAHRIAANAPLAVRSARLAALEGNDMTVRQAMLLEQLLWGVLRDTEDRAEGRTAFAQKRKPEFRGR